MKSERYNRFNIQGLTPLQLGRFLQSDPIRFNAGDVNLYRYVANNPINLSDPLGLWGIGFYSSDLSSGFNIGVGNPTVAFTPDSLNDVGHAAQATVDGLLPFSDPFADLGEMFPGLNSYDPDCYEFSHTMGRLAYFGILAGSYVPPAVVYHHTTIAGAEGIAATGGIQASASGIGGMGTYLSGSSSAVTATLQGAAGTGAVVPVSSAGLGLTPTIVPGSFVVRGASVLVR